MEKLIKQIADALIQKNLKLITAESCTGGGLGYWLTTLPGASTWFEGGFITYSNEAKMQMLNVKQESIEHHGAVSEVVVKEMAQGALANSIANVSVAITGIAGPDGGSETKPIGTVWIACAERKSFLYAGEYLFQGDRQAIRYASIQQALDNLLMLLQ